MKRLFLLASLLVAAPVQAEVIYPYAYAGLYCQARQVGYGYTKAIELALDYARSSSQKIEHLRIRGESHRADYVAGAYMVSKLCPHWLEE